MNPKWLGCTKSNSRMVVKTDAANLPNFIPKGCFILERGFFPTLDNLVLNGVRLEPQKRSRF